MSLTNDVELRELFRQEIGERVGRLIEGARAMASGTVDEEFAGAMFREGHTIKGTSRVMGYEAISRAGQILEARWREVTHREHQGSAELGAALEELCQALLGAIDADPNQGTGELLGALGKVSRVTSAGFNGVEPAEAPEIAGAPVTIDDREGPPAAGLIPGAESPTAPLRRTREDEPAPGLPKGDAADLGGLLNALDTWASQESARVNAANLYRLINTVAAVGVETEGLRTLLLDLADTVAADSDTYQQITRLSNALESVVRSVSAAKSQALTLASAELREITNTFAQLIRYLAKKTDKEIRFELVGDDASVDRQVLERLADPLRQLIVNAIEHGIETADEREESGKARTATLSLRAQVKDHRLEIIIEDDGRGVDWGAVHRTAVRRGLLPPDRDPEQESLRSLLFAPGFSTATQASELVGDGSGLTAVAGAIESLHGSLRFETKPGQGTRISLATPTSRALQDAILVRAAGHEWGIPETAIVDRFDLDDVQIVAAPHRKEMVWMDRRIPIASFAQAVALVEREDPKQVVVLSSPVGPVGLTVPQVIGQQQVAAKELGPLLGGAPHLTGAALLGGGDVVVLVDPSRLAERVRELPLTVDARPVVLVVDDSQGARQVVAAALSSSGFETCVAGSVDEAFDVLDETVVDALVVDFSMPGSDGVELVQRVRAKFGSLPVIMLSGVATEADQARAQDAGVDTYFDKADFREGALAASLRSLVEARSGRFGESA